MPGSFDLKLLAFLRADGPQTPGSLMAKLDISQPTLSRMVRAQKKTLIALGASRNRKLAALRSIRNLGGEFPVFQIGENGDITRIGTLYSLYPALFSFLPKDDPFKPEVYPGVPFFLDDARPQGFLGRSFSLKHSELQLPPRTLDWTQDDVLEAMARRGEDLVGNLMIGAESFERLQVSLGSRTQTIDAAHVDEAYIQAAQAATEGDLVGSSAGGEHPKFGATITHKKHVTSKVLVKFSPKGDSFQAKRWRDLLISESAALTLLQSHGLESVQNRIIDAGGRIFLETIRFDRVGARGRKGVLSLGALENEWTGGSPHWATTALQLRQEDRIGEEDLGKIQTLECFGRLIANSDRHPGNLSFYWNPGDARARLAPVYDMLPMLYAPTTGGEDAGRTFQLPTYDHTLLSAWKTALPMAKEYWETLAGDTRLSKEFRRIARENIGILSSKF
jgi:hypothetical protein